MKNLEGSWDQAFESVIYRSLNPDLEHLSEDQLRDHFQNHGQSEGRVANSICDRSSFVNLIPTALDVLEIGPFDAPCVRGSNVEYLDLLSKEELMARARDLGRNPDTVPQIHWVTSDGRLNTVTKKYDVLLSCHNIEHQFDLVGHLNEAQNILRDNGHYFLIVPDSRYCFDHFIAPSTIADVLDAHYEKRTNHTLRSVIEHRVLTTHNDPVRHWAGDHSLRVIDSDEILAAINEFQNATEVLDVHAWQFTPISFVNIVNNIYELGLTKFKVTRCYHTLRNDFEFKVILSKQ